MSPLPFTSGIPSKVGRLVAAFLFLTATLLSSPAQSTDDNWDDRFGAPSAGDVKSIWVSGTNLLVAGNAGPAAGGGRADYIARWNGRGWSPMGTSLTGVVNVVTEHAGFVYAGGVFVTAGDGLANALAKWDGTNWTNVGLGVTNELLASLVAVNAMAREGNDLYVGGAFTKAGGVGAGSIARWDGTNWSALGVTGLTGGINAVAVVGNDIYAAGSFTTIGGVSANSIARWNGTSWSALATGITQSGGSQAGQVFALAVNGTDLYVGGFFTAAGGLANYGFAKWNGTNIIDRNLLLTLRG